MVGLTHINPAGMHESPAFSQGVLTSGPGRLLVVGGQNGVDASGQVVGPGLAEQTAQALRNVLAVLAEVGATQRDVVRLGIYVVAGEDVMAGYAASAEVWGAHPTAVTVLEVAGLGPPGALVEIEALAYVPEQD
ncbi:RidA family protein [Georgenia subflava]|uniref:RidA family protein n=1 Tax=Georgenia subflava TaxID=1622177 RepID=A0A6N7ECZ5_9MICO|nr:RidA family protein [Georgenia subflava]MPV35850.1 RidA family protein [Georgenia subflava]